MPATQGYRLNEWHEPPFLTGIHSLEATIDTRVFDPNNIDDVTECLLETNEQVDAYRWVLSDEEVRELALESAREIVRNRQRQYADNLLQMRFQLAKEQRDSASVRGRLAVVVSIAQNIQTGETMVDETHVPIGRVFG